MIDVLDFAYSAIGVLAGVEMGLFFWNLYQNKMLRRRRFVRVRHQHG